MKKLICLVFLASACSDSMTTGDDAGDDAVDVPPIDRRGTAVAVAGDFEATGILSAVVAPDTVVPGIVDGVVGSDPALRWIGDELFIVNRFGTGGDNITIVDVHTLELVDQISTGAGSNPQDVALVGDKLYVISLETSSILVIDRSNPDEIGEIDLSSLDDDGAADCVSVAAAGDRIYVACGLLDGFSVVRNGVVVVIDTETDTIATTLEMPAANPQGWFTPAGEDLLIATVPSFTDYTKGCIVRVSTGDEPTATCGPTNMELGGYAAKMVFHDHRLWAVVTAFTPTFESSGWLVRFDGFGNQSDKLTPPEHVLQDMAICGGHVFAADKAFGADGIRVYTIGNVDEETSEPLDIGLPPVFGNAIACQAP